MANTSSSTNIATNDQMNSPCQTNQSSANENQTESRKNKRKLTPEQCEELNEKLLEMEQIKYEEQLVYERLHSINLEKQHLQSLLNLLHTMDNPERVKNPRTRHSQIPKTNSSSRFD